jgi:hypothetical protein
MDQLEEELHGEALIGENAEALWMRTQLLCGQIESVKKYLVDVNPGLYHIMVEALHKVYMACIIRANEEGAQFIIPADMAPVKVIIIIQFEKSEIVTQNAVFV